MPTTEDDGIQPSEEQFVPRHVSQQFIPRCRHVSPSPWGPTQCVLPMGHLERHACDDPRERDDDA